MRIHSQTLVTVVVTLLFVSGTVGCRSNGGAWYNPKSYTWTNPFTKSNDAPVYSADAPSNAKPSLDAQPNLDIPSGGYTEGGSSHASRSSIQSTNNSSLEHGTTPSQSMTQGTSSSYGGGYSVAETSPYPPPYASGQSSLNNTSATNPYQYPSTTVQTNSQYPATTPLNTPSYGSDSSSGSQQYQPTSAVNYPPATPNYSSGDQFGGTAPIANPATASSNYSPFGPAPQNDPYAAPVQQPAPATSALTGGYYEQAASPQPVNPQPIAAPQAGSYSELQPSAPQQPYQSAQPSPPATGYGY